jgi:hypothetical protein
MKERSYVMRLNPNTIRGILLTVEEKCDFDNIWEYRKNDFESIYLAELTHEEIAYHIKQCDKSGLIDNVHYYDGGDCIVICDLTPLGHEFLANVRNDSIWKTTMQKGAEASLPVLIELAKKVAMKHFLG